MFRLCSWASAIFYNVKRIRCAAMKSMTQMTFRVVSDAQCPGNGEYFTHR
jgi:hypothetical protein